MAVIGLRYWSRVLAANCSASPWYTLALVGLTDSESATGGVRTVMVAVADTVPLLATTAAVPEAVGVAVSTPLALILTPVAPETAQVGVKVTGAPVWSVPRAVSAMVPPWYTNVAMGSTLRVVSRRPWPTSMSALPLRPLLLAVTLNAPLTEAVNRPLAEIEPPPDTAQVTLGAAMLLPNWSLPCAVYC